MNPRISVIVPNYNHSRFLHQRIDSILNQSFQDFELILLDDASTDGSVDVLMSYQFHPKVRHILINDLNSGSTFSQWDKGVELAVGEWIWIAESDDWAELTFLDTLWEVIENNPSVGLIYCASRLVDANGNITYENSRLPQTNTFWQGKSFVKEMLSYENSIWNASMMMFKKELYPEPTQKHLFQKMKYCGDWMFYLLVAAKGDVVFVPKVLNNFRQHDGNVSGKAEREGLAWLEGLDILRYMISGNKASIKLFYGWCKNICRSRRRMKYSDELFDRIKKKYRSVSFWGWLMIYPLSLFYKVK